MLHSGPNGDRSRNQAPLIFGQHFGDLRAGDKIGPYTVKSFLARGAFALIARGTDEEGNNVALKFGGLAGGGRHVTRMEHVSSHRRRDEISPDETPAEAVFIIAPKNGMPGRCTIDFLEQYRIYDLLRLEHEILRKAEHPIMIKALTDEPLTFNGGPVIAMEFARGQTLREKIRKLETVNTSLFDQIAWFAEIVDALIKLRNSGQMDAHRDLKPENIIITPSGNVKIIDPSPHPDSFNGCFTTTPWFNPLFHRDSKADVTAIGIMLYELLTGMFPFDEAPYSNLTDVPINLNDTLQLGLIYYLSYTPIRDLNPTAPEMLVRIVRRCILEQDYGLNELSSDLKKFLASCRPKS